MMTSPGDNILERHVRSMAAPGIKFPVTDHLMRRIDEATRCTQALFSDGAGSLDRAGIA